MRAFPALLVALACSLSGPVRATPAARELVVQLSPAALGTGASARDARALPAAVRTRFAALGLVPTRAMAERMAGPLHALPEPYGFHPERIVLLEAASAELAASALVALETDAFVDWAEPVRTRGVALVGYGAPAPATPARATALDSLPDDPYFRDGHQYGLWNLGPGGFYGGVLRADVHASEAWRVSAGDNGLKLAVTDTGIDPDQPELAGLMPDGSPRLTDAFNATDDPDPSVRDLYGHGTPVTGVMAARTNDGAHFAATSGVAGVCGGDGATNAGCRIVPIKISPDHSGEASSFDIARGLMHAADVGARAVNLSFAGPDPTRIERLALTYALLNGCIPVCAAGNSGFDAETATLPLYPAAFAREGLAISVGASDESDRRTLFSSYPVGLDLVAPGIDIMTTFMSYPSFFGASYPGYVAAAGTSFAAPFVTGAVGLLAAARPDLMDTDFQHVIRESADDIGAPGVDAQTAYGRLNLARMLARVPDSIGVWHDETVADSFTVEGEGLLRVGERGPGTMARYLGAHWSTRLAAYATVAIPDSFLSVTGVWPRVGGTLAVRGDFSIPYFAPTAQVLRSDATSATFRGYLYRVSEDSCDVCDDRYVPLAPSNVRFGFTVMGRVDRAAKVRVIGVAPEGSGTPGQPCEFRFEYADPDTVTTFQLEFVSANGERRLLARTALFGGNVAVAALPCLGPVDVPGELVLTLFDEHGHRDQTSVSVPFTIRGGACSAPLASFRVTPTPFATSVSVFAPGRGTVRVLDATGRVVRRYETGGGPLQWDGHDDRGGRAAAGLYWVRFDGAAGTVTKRVVKLGR